jgi:hypothetical protein
VRQSRLRFWAALALLNFLLASCAMNESQETSGDDVADTFPGSLGAPPGAAEGATPPEPDADSPPPSALPDECGVLKVQSFIGRRMTEKVKREFTIQSGAKTIRWLSPNSFVTQDYSASRLNVIMDADGKIEMLNCG